MDPKDIVDAGTAAIDVISSVVPSDVPDGAAPAMFDIAKVLSQWNVLLMISVWFMIQTSRKILPSTLFQDGALLSRLLPVAPVVMCNAAMWIPGPWIEPNMAGAQRVILGTVLGMGTANIHTIASRLGLASLIPVVGETDPLKKKSKKAPTPTPTDDAPTDPDGKAV